MVRTNVIEKAILELEGGSFHKLMDDYLFKRYKTSNLQSLGAQFTTNKSTKGTPDSYIQNENGKYTLLMYGTVSDSPFNKLKKDIESCFDTKKLDVPIKDIEKVICTYTSSNLRIEQKEKLENLKPGIDIELIGLDTITKDLLTNYPFILKDYLGIPLDSGQVYSPKTFIEVHDKSGINAPLDITFNYREKELDILKNNINSNTVNLITGPAGMGKTKLAIEACLEYESLGWEVLCVKNHFKELHDDVRRYINQEGKYLLFVDDADSTEDLSCVWQNKSAELCNGDVQSPALI